MLRVRMERRAGPLELRTGGAVFSTDWTLDEADALLCEWAPTRSLVRFRGPRAWYCGEPIANPAICRGRWQRAWRWALRTLAPHEVLHFGNPDRRYALPPITHWTDLTATGDGERLPRAAAVVSNAGGLRGGGPDVDLRNRFVTAPRVDLYGRRGGWRAFPVVGRLPASYRGEVPGSWLGVEKVACLARYQVAVCLENTCAAHYFTEKFVDAVRAGCVPVYRAHPTVRDGILRGARWVDPQDFGLDPEATLAHALAQDRRAYAEPNAAWLAGEAVAATRGQAVFARIAGILAAGQPALPPRPPPPDDLASPAGRG